LVWSGAGFDAPEANGQQQMTVARSLLGQAQNLRIAVLPNQPPPTPAERGVRILLTQADAAALDGRAATVEVSYNPLPINAANGLAVSLQGAGATTWVSRDAPSPPQGPLRFELPQQTAPQAIGLRALSNGSGEAFGFEITRIAITPHP
jgi:hypothetical protein